MEQNKIILIKVDWYEKYCGVEKLLDSYDSKRDLQYEKYTFCNINNMCYGFVVTRGNEKSKLSNDVIENFKNKITFVFISKNPSNNKWTIVGFYLNGTATENQTIKDFRTNICTQSRNAYLIPVTQRKPLEIKKLFSRLSIAYFENIKDDNVKKLLEKEINKLIANKDSFKIDNTELENIDAQDYLNTIKEELIKPDVNIEKVMRIINSYSRDQRLAEQTLINANYKCEYDNNHISFIDKHNKQYNEAHHLIPISCQSEFKNSLDIIENMVSLCPNCHREIHNGKNNKQIIQTLYNQRKNALKKANIDIDLEKLYKFYN